MATYQHCPYCGRDTEWKIRERYERAIRDIVWREHYSELWLGRAWRKLLIAVSLVTLSLIVANWLGTDVHEGQTNFAYFLVLVLVLCFLWMSIFRVITCPDCVPMSMKEAQLRAEYTKRYPTVESLPELPDATTSIGGA